MPYKSQAQEKFFNVNRKKLEAQGVDVDEWNKASKGKKLPPKKAGKGKEKSMAKAPKKDAKNEPKGKFVPGKGKKEK